MLQFSSLMVQLGPYLPLLAPYQEQLMTAAWGSLSLLRPKSCEMLRDAYLKGDCIPLAREASSSMWSMGCQMVKTMYQKGDCCRLAREAMANMTAKPY